MIKLSREELLEELFSHNFEGSDNIKIELNDVESFIHEDKKIYKLFSGVTKVFSSTIASVTDHIEDVLMCFFIHPKHFNYKVFSERFEETYQLFDDPEHNLFSISFDEKVKSDECQVTIYITVLNKQIPVNKIIEKKI